MKPADLRNATWREVQSHITADMLRVHAAWQQFGPGTTRQVAARSGISLLTLRPRTTDLYQLGLVELTTSEGHEGIYAFCSLESAETSAKWRSLKPETKPAALGIPGEPTTTQLSWAAGMMAQARANKRRRAEEMRTSQAELFA